VTGGGWLRRLTVAAGSQTLTTGVWHLELTIDAGPAARLEPGLSRWAYQWEDDAEAPRLVVSQDQCDGRPGRARPAPPLPAAVAQSGTITSG
jgi:hypothetical protein